ncbi:MAG: NAD(+) synthase [Bacillota bacterium]
MKITIAQMKVVPGRPDINFARMSEIINQAKTEQAELVVFPEMAIPGYLIGDLWEQDSYLRDCEEFGRRIIEQSADICIIFGNIAVDWHKIGDDGRVRKYNAAFVANHGTLCGADNFLYPYRIKSLLPNYREFEETRHFYCTRKLAIETGVHPAELIKPVHININGRAYSLALIICEDGWDENYSLKPVDLLCANNCIDLIINISCSPYTYGKNDKRHLIFSNHAAHYKLPLIYLNACGIQNNGKTLYTFDGCSAIYDAHGLLRYSAEKYVDAICTVDSDEFAILPTVNYLPDNIADIYAAISYGCKEFMQSIGMNRVVIGASGGIDSAVAAALYVDILGPDQVLLVNMPSEFNSQTTKSLAKELAAALGCNYTTISVQDSVEHTMDQLQTAEFEHLGKNQRFTISPSSLVHENIQARDRSGRILAAVAASWNAGFTCNANKTETSVGYSTLYGDHAGFLATLADLWKYQIYALAEYINNTIFHREVVPRGSIDIVPSAELSTAQNVDEGKGDPIIYPYHDYLFKSFIEYWNRTTPEDIITWYRDGVLEIKLGCQPGIVAATFPTAEHFVADLERWWRQFSGMGLAKRIQAPPIIAISRRAYGFDLRESQCGIYYTQRYLQIKSELLNHV